MGFILILNLTNHFFCYYFIVQLKTTANQNVSFLMFPNNYVYSVSNQLHYQLNLKQLVVYIVSVQLLNYLTHFLFYFYFIVILQFLILIHRNPSDFWFLICFHYFIHLCHLTIKISLHFTYLQSLYMQFLYWLI